MNDIEALRQQLADLIQSGDRLRRREFLSNLSASDREEAARAFEARAPKGQDGDPIETSTVSDADLKKLEDELTKYFSKPDFGREYQAWYSVAVRVVGQLLADREQEFRSLYRVERRKGVPDAETYGVADYVGGLVVTEAFSGVSSFNTNVVAMKKFEQQVDILRSAEARLDSTIIDVGRVLHASILDTEIDASKSLLKANHVRAAGVIAGVVLEAHLKRLLGDHGISMRKAATLANLNDALKNADVYGIPQWRKIQYLSDLRNLCAHKSERDPSRDDIADMVEQVDKIVRTVF